MALKKCRICGKSFTGRTDARTCSPRCRKRLQLLRLSFGVRAPKKNLAKTLILVFFSVLSLLSVFFSYNAPKTSAAASSNLNFQSRLLSSTGNVVADGTYNIEFKLYDASSSSGSSQGSCSGDSNCLWTETRTGANKVRVVNGYMSVYLGSVTSFPTTIKWDQQLWLSMNIGGTGAASWDGEMNPRIALSAIPYSFIAGQLATGTGSSRGTLSFASLGQATDITLPDPGASTATVCYQNASACGFAPTTGGSGYIQLQGTTPGSPQTGNFNISGTGIASTLLQSAQLDAASSGALGIGNNGTATSVSICNSANCDSISIGTNTDADTISIGDGSDTVGITAGTTTISGNTSGSADALAVTNSTSTGKVANFKDNTTSVFTIADGGAALFQNQTNTANAFQIQDASGTNVFNVNTLSGTTRIGLGTYSAGTISQTGTAITGSSTTFTSAMGGGTIVYSDGTTATVSFNTATSLTSSVSKTVTAGSTYKIQYGGLSVSNSGSVTARNTTDSTTAFALQTSDGVSLFNADTTNRQLTITAAGLDQTITTAPTVLSSIQDATNLQGPTSIAVSGRYAYITAYDASRVTVTDVSNPATPVVVGSVLDATKLAGASGIQVVGRYAYVLGRTNAYFNVIDVSNPSSPSLVASINDATLLNDAIQMTIVGRYAYIVDQVADRVTIVDISNPLSPVFRGSITDSTNLDGANSIQVRGTYAFITDFVGNRLAAVNVSNPDSPTVVSSLLDATNLGGANSVYVSGRYAYVVGQTSDRLTVVDISNPASMSVVGNVHAGGQLNGAYWVQVSGRYAYVAASGGARLTVVDISTPAAPVIAGSVTSTNLTGASRLVVSGKYAYVVNYSSNRFTVVDLFGLNVSGANIGNINTSSLTVAEDTTIGNSLAVNGGLNVGFGGIQTGGGLSAAGPVLFQNSTNSTSAFHVQSATGVSVFNVDTANSKIGTVNTTAASTNSQVLTIKSGDASGSTSNSGDVVLDSGTATGTAGNVSIGTGAYAHNVTVGNATGASNTTIQAGSGNLNLTVSGASNTGIVAKTTTNSTAAFQVQNTNSRSLLAVDTSASIVTIGNTTDGSQISLGASGNVSSTIRKNMSVTGTVNANDLVQIDSANDGNVKQAVANSSTVFGVATSTVTNTTTDIVISGVYQVSADATALVPGDLLVSSSTAGKVTKAGSTVAGGTVLGRALSTKGSGAGLVWVSLAPSFGASDSLQTAYNNSTGSTTPEVKLDSTRAAFDVQDADSTIGGSIFTVRASNSGGGGLGAAIFDVQSTGALALTPTTASSTIVIGSSAQTGTITLGQSTDTNTINIGNGATASGKTQTISIGANGASGSTTNVTIGSTIAGTTTINGATAVSINGDTTIAGVHTFNTGTGNVSLNGDTTIASGKAFTVTGGATNLTGNTSGDAFTVSNSSSTGKVANFKDNTTSVFTIADGGAALFQNQTDSANAFQIQNASGTNIFNVNALNGMTRIGLGTYSTGTIAQTTTAITGSGTTFTSAMDGGTIIYSDGTTATVTYLTATTLTSSVSKTVTAGSSYKIQYGGLAVSSTGTVTARNTADSTTAFQVQNAAGTDILTTDSTTSQTTLRGINSDATAGSELIASNNYTTANWTKTGWSVTSSLATHTTGNTNSLIETQLNPVANSLYVVVFTVTGGSGVGSVTPQIGGANGTPVVGNSVNETQYIFTNGSANLKFVPTSTWVNKISNVSVKLITKSTAALVVKSSAGNSNVEIRTSTQSNNTFIGTTSGQYNVTGTQNTALGIAALQTNATGYNNTAIGTQAIQNNISGYSNSVLGQQALQTNTTGYNNSALGEQALQSNTTGAGNAAVGEGSLLNNSTGNQNTAIGTESLKSNNTGSGNTAIGVNSGYTTVSANANAIGSNNTFIGFNAGPGVDNSISLQSAAAIGQGSVVNASNTLVLGCISGVNGCTASTNIGIASGGYSNNPLTVAASTYTVTITQSTTTITGSGFTAGMNNGTIYYADGTSAVVTYVNATTLTAASKTVASSSATIVYGGLNVTSTGALSLQNSADSTAALQVQNASSLSMLLVDTTNKNIQIGSSTTDANAVFLTVDSYNTAADPTAPANGAMYYNTSTNVFRCRENGIWKNCIDPPSNASTADQSPTAATLTYLSGSSINIPQGGVRVGSQFVWRMSVSKTAAGTAAPSIAVVFGTNGTTADTARATFTLPIETPDVDTAQITIFCTVRSVSATGTISCHLVMTHNDAQCLGFITISSCSSANAPQSVDLTITSGTFDNTVANSIMGVTLDSGTANAFTFQQIQAQTINL
jgi:hypothetical protein